MTTHRIDLGPMTRRQMLTPGFYRDEQIVCSEAPIYDAARWLLEHRRADPTDRIETWRGTMMCLSGVVGTLAAWTVVESDKGGLQMRRWADVLAGRARLVWVGDVKRKITIEATLAEQLAEYKERLEHNYNVMKVNAR